MESYKKTGYNNLINVLSEALNNNKFNFSSNNLRKRGVIYYSYLSKYLQISGYIDEFGNIIRNYSINHIANEYITWCRIYIANLTLTRKNKNREKTNTKKYIKNFLYNYSDKELVEELRRREYNVICKKQIEI